MRFGGLIGAACAAAIAGSCLAAELPLLPGIRDKDARVVVDPSAVPWNAVVKVQTNIGTRCTGTLVGPATVLTAAHCLYNRRTQGLLQPVSLHVLIGYQRGAFRWHRLVARYTVGPGFDGAAKPPQTSDWAWLELAEPVPDAVRPLPIATEPPASGVAVALGGYNQDRAELLMADPDCHIGIVTRRPGGTLLLHDCSATRGTSGGPLLTREGEGWAVIGVNIAAGELANVALAVPR
jgi:protease YdgD